MRPGKTFRIGTQEHAQPVLRTFMLLSVAGEYPTTNTNAQLCMQLGIFLEVPRICAGSCGFLRTSPRRPDA